MAEEKAIQMLDAQGNSVYPKTLSKLVINSSGENLGTVEAGAQVNKLEKIKVNGVELTVVNKAANIVIPAAAVYELKEQESADDNYASTYFLTKDNVQVGTKINIAKDQFVKTGSVKKCTVANSPIEGLAIGDIYIDLEFQNDDKHLYIPANDLVDIYTAGNGITIVNNEISINENVVATKSFVEGLPSVQSGITSSKVSAYDSHKDNVSLHVNTVAETNAIDSGITASKVESYEAHKDSSNLHVTPEQKAEWTAKQAALTTEQLKAVNSGITSTKLSELEAFGSSKQDALTTEQLAAVNSGITSEAKEGYDTHLANTTIHIESSERTSWNAKKTESEYTEEKAEVNVRVGDIEDTATELNSLVLFYEEFSGTNPTEPTNPETVTVTVDAPEGSTIEFKEIN